MAFAIPDVHLVDLLYWYKECTLVSYLYTQVTTNEVFNLVNSVTEGRSVKYVHTIIIHT